MKDHEDILVSFLFTLIRLKLTCSNNHEATDAWHYAKRWKGTGL